MTSTHTTSTTIDPASERPPLRGDEERLYIAYSNRLEAVVSRLVNTSAANVEDACSFAWMQLLIKQPRRDSAFSWLTKVAMRQAIRLDQRSRGRDVALEDEVLLGGRLPDDKLEERILICETLEQLTGIHERRRGMLVMHSVGFTYDEIADAHGISAKRACALVYRARLQVRERMGLSADRLRSPE